MHFPILAKKGKFRKNFQKKSDTNFAKTKIVRFLEQVEQIAYAIYSETQKELQVTAAQNATNWPPFQTRRQ
jgi:hypothetical protein